MIVAQLVRASACGAEGREFESRLSPKSFTFKSKDMHIVNINTLAKEDDKESFKSEFNTQEIKLLELKEVLIVECGTGNGRTGVTLYFTDKEGNKYFANTSARMIVNGIAPATRGASERFGDDLNQA